MDEQDTVIQALPEDTDPEKREFELARFEKRKQEVREDRERLERSLALRDARELIPPVADDEPPTRGELRSGVREKVRVLNEPHTYRPDGKFSFFRDMYHAQKGDREAAARMQRHEQETRDVTTADPGAGVFVPPAYLADLWAEFPREARPFANALPSMALPDVGMTLTIPRITTGTSAAVQINEGDAVTEVDIDGTLLSVPVRTIAGQNDVSIQALERTAPGLDFLIFQDLRADYDEKLDTQCLSGTGSNGQHLGVRAVSGVNTTTYTDGSPTAAELVPKVYDAIQKVATNRHRMADMIVLHPTRAAWLASNLSSTFPLFQLGTLLQAAGSQSAGFVDNFAGLKTVLDANIGTVYGAGTNQDEVYVVRSADLILMEGALRTRVHEQSLSGTLQIRLQVFAYSAFISARYPSAITVMSGTGLTAASF